MRALAPLGLVVAACASTARAPEPALLGPVTAFARLGDAWLACSQAGVARLDSAPPALWCDPGFRVVALATDGDALLAAGGVPGEAGLVARLAAGRVVTQQRLAADLVSAVAVVTGAVVCGCDDGRVLELDPDTLAPRRELRRHGGAVRALAVAGRDLASAGLDGNLMLGPLDAPPVVLRDHSAGIECAAWSGDGRLLASGARDGRVRVHDASGRLLGSTAPLGARVTCITASDAGSFVAGLGDGRVLRLDPTDVTAPSELWRGSGPIHALDAHGRLAIGRAGAIDVATPSVAPGS